MAFKQREKERDEYHDPRTRVGHLAGEAEVGPSLAKYEGNWYFDPARRPGRCPSGYRAHIHLSGQGDLQLGRLRRPRRPDRQGRGLGLSQGQARPRADPGPLRLLRRQPGWDQGRIVGKATEHRTGVGMMEECAFDPIGTPYGYGEALRCQEIPFMKRFIWTADRARSG